MWWSMEGRIWKSEFAFIRLGYGPVRSGRGEASSDMGWRGRTAQEMGLGFESVFGSAADLSQRDQTPHRADDQARGDAQVPL